MGVLTIRNVVTHGQFVMGQLGDDLFRRLTGFLKITLLAGGEHSHGLLPYSMARGIAAIG